MQATHSAEFCVVREENGNALPGGPHPPIPSGCTATLGHLKRDQISLIDQDNDLPSCAWGAKRNRRFVDSSLEGAGFELSVPRQIAKVFRGLSETTSSARWGLGIDLGEVDKDCGEPLEAERRQIVKCSSKWSIPPEVSISGDCTRRWPPRRMPARRILPNCC